MAPYSCRATDGTVAGATSWRNRRKGCLDWAMLRLSEVNH